MPEKNKTDDYPVGPDGKKLKPCCVCLDTKRVRDECIMEKVGNPSSLKDRAANDPTVFTIMEKAPSRAFSSLKAHTHFK